MGEPRLWSVSVVRLRLILMSSSDSARVLYELCVGMADVSLKRDEEKFGSPHCRHCQLKLEAPTIS